MTYTIDINPFFSDLLDPSKPFTRENTLPAESVSPVFTPESSRALGSVIPEVIGTQVVSGIWFIGGTVTEQRLVGYNTTKEVIPSLWKSYSEQLASLGVKSIGGSSSPYSYPAIDPFFQKDTVVVTNTPVYEPVTTASMGYILAYDPFERGYDLIRLEINDEVAFDAENGIPANVPFRFYGGRQTKPDPIVKDIVGEDADAYQNFVMLFLEGYETTSRPRVKAVISNAATSGGGTTEIAWESGGTPNTLTSFDAGDSSSFDVTDELIYQLIDKNDVPSLNAIYLAALDIASKEERYRVPLEDTASYVTGVQYTLPLWGTNHVFVRLVASGQPTKYRVYDALSGKIVCDYTGLNSINTDAIIPFGRQWVIFGHAPSTIVPMYALIDLTEKTIDIDQIGSGVTVGAYARGRASPGSISFFFVDRDGASFLNVYEATFDGDSWAMALLWSAATAVSQLYYDSSTGYLIAARQGTGSGAIINYVDPNTGLADVQFTDPDHDYNAGISTGLGVPGRERLYPRPGYAFFFYGESHLSDGGIVLLDIEQQDIREWATNDGSVQNDEFRTNIFSQRHLAWYAAATDDHWVEHVLPNSSPGLIALTSILTDIAALTSYPSAQLNYVGFTGLQAYGLGIYSDTTSRQLYQSVASMFDFYFSDTGVELYFQKPGRDGDFSVDATLDDDSIIYQPQAGSSISGQDEADLRVPIRVEIDYISKEAGYKVRPVSFSMSAGPTNSARTSRYVTSLVLGDEEAQRLVTEKFMELQAKRRKHVVTAAPEHAVRLPGNIVELPYGSDTFTTVVDRVSIDPLNMAVELALTDFQTEVSATITAVSNAYGVVPLILATQYVHLDIPLLRYSDDLDGAGLVQYGVVAPRGQDSWPGGYLYAGSSLGTLEFLFTQAPHFGVIGVCIDVLGTPVDPFGSTDGSTVIIRRTSGSIDLVSNKTQTQVEAGANNAFIGVAGRWEWVGFTTITDNGDNTYTLSGFVRRGYRGTEVFSAQHEVGDAFVLYSDDWVQRYNRPLEELDTNLLYSAAGIGQDPTSAPISSHAIIGAAETPYAPINIAGALGTPEGIDLTWDYRSRVASGTNPSDHGEATLEFEIDILDISGGSELVVRPVTGITDQFYHYGFSDIVADWGGYPDYLDMDVYMISAVVGRGYAGRHRAVFSYTKTFDSTVLSFDRNDFTFDGE